MEFNITAVEFVFDKLSIAHGGGYVGMSQNLLNIVYIRTVFQQVSRKGVAECMGSYILLNFCAFRIGFKYFPKALSCHTLTLNVDEQRLFVGMEHQKLS